MNGLLVAIDFEKAADSINHDFMFKALSVSNFGPSLIRWIQIFYKKISTTVMNNDYTHPLLRYSEVSGKETDYPLIYL